MEQIQIQNLSSSFYMKIIWTIETQINDNQFVDSNLSTENNKNFKSDLLNTYSLAVA